MNKLRFFHLPWTCSCHCPVSPLLFIDRLLKLVARERGEDPGERGVRKATGQVKVKCCHSVSQSVISGPAALASPGNLLKVHVLGPTPDQLKRKLWGGPAICFNQGTSWLWCSLNFENHCATERSSERWARSPHWRSSLDSSLFPSFAPSVLCSLASVPSASMKVLEVGRTSLLTPHAAVSTDDGKSPGPLGKSSGFYSSLLLLTSWVT